MSRPTSVEFVVPSPVLEQLSRASESHDSILNYYTNRSPSGSEASPSSGVPRISIVVEAPEEEEEDYAERMPRQGHSIRPSLSAVAVAPKTVQQRLASKPSVGDDQLFVTVKSGEHKRTRSKTGARFV